MNVNTCHMVRSTPIVTKFELGQPICSGLITFYWWYITLRYDIDLCSFDLERL